MSSHRLLLTAQLKRPYMRSRNAKSCAAKPASWCNSAPLQTPAGAARSPCCPSRPKSNPAIALVLESTAETPDAGPQVATAVRDLRHVRNLSQRQLAARMGVPRTYISKIENGKAMPTLSSLDRLARALQVDISALLRDAPTRHRDETAVLLNDPFLAEIAKYTAHLTSTQKSIFLNHVRELSQSRNRRMA